MHSPLPWYEAMGEAQQMELFDYLSQSSPLLFVFSFVTPSGASLPALADGYSQFLSFNRLLCSHSLPALALQFPQDFFSLCYLLTFAVV